MAPIVLPDLVAPRRPGAQYDVAVFVYPGVTTFEIDQPVKGLAQRLDADVSFVGLTVGAVTGVEPVRDVIASHDVSDPDAAYPDVVVVPGGLGWEALVSDFAAMQWLTQVSKQATGVLAISTGSLLLAAAGELAGQSATGHWLARTELEQLGANVSTARTVQSDDERIMTASGHNAAIDAARILADRVRWGAPAPGP